VAPLFRDRRDAGRQLLARIRPLVGPARVVVLAIPPGGVPVALEIARGLGAPLDVFVMRLLRVPEHPEVAMGALASGGTRVLDEEVIESFRVRADALHAATTIELQALEATERDLRQARPYPSLRDAVLVLVDDAAGDGTTLRAAVQALRGRRPAAIVVTAPVMSRRGYERLARGASACVALAISEHDLASAEVFDEPAPPNGEIREILAESAAAHRASVRPQSNPVGPRRPAALRSAETAKAGSSTAGDWAL
jgi:putative phosphoribosyl transferase